MKYDVGNWPVQGLGNHRAVLQVDAPAAAVRAHIPWRRHDAEPQLKGLVVVDAATGTPVGNVLRLGVTAERGDLVFEPVSGAGLYWVYFMPYVDEGWQHLPSTRYLPPRNSTDAGWAAQQIAALAADPGSLPAATVVGFQAISDFHRMDPMEVMATHAEVCALLQRSPGRSYLVFPEGRERPIRMLDALPQCWIQSGPRDAFQGEACRGEFFAFQLGVFASAVELTDVRVDWSGLDDGEGHEIPAGAMTCINTQGVDWLGRAFRKQLSVPAGAVQPVWLGVQIPADAVPGAYSGRIVVHADRLESTPMELSLQVSEQQIARHGDDELWRQARLRWLDSTMGIDDDAVAPYSPVRVAGNRIDILGRSLRIGAMGLPERITTRFDRSVQRADAPEQEMLAGPVRFAVRCDGDEVEFGSANCDLSVRGPGTAAWTAAAHSDQLSYTCHATLECDGYLTCSLTLTARLPVALDDTRLEIPLRPAFARYMMGIGHKGGQRGGDWHWKWSEERANHMVWLGAVHGGIQCKLMYPDDVWELYNLKTPGLPESWHNGGLGGCDVTDGPGRVELVAYCGPRTLEAGEEVSFRFGLLITPFHALPREHWNWRYYGQGAKQATPAEVVDAADASVIHLHHANPLNPHINYPFVRADELRAYAEAAHTHDMRLVLYYTVRELSNYAAELWAFRSLGDEIYRTDAGFRLADHFLDADATPACAADGERRPGLLLPGGSWLWEHLGEGFVPAWHHPLGDGVQDAAIATQGLSRLHNYYVEGLNWLVRRAGIDGIYLDGIGYDRQIMKRVRKVLQRARPDTLVTFHSGNNFHPEYGLNSPAVQYLEHLPYCDSVWFGEGYDYDDSPDYWLVEISGIPFGLSGEMLQGGGNLWRGMLYYGMANRLGWNAESRPEPLWRFWDDSGIADMEMIGYWDPRCPVQTGHEGVLATAYVGDRAAIVALASWADESQRCSLSIEWETLGCRGPMVLHAPAVEGFQEERVFEPRQEVAVEPGRGWLLMVERE